LQCDDDDDTIYSASAVSINLRCNNVKYVKCRTKYVHMHPAYTYVDHSIFNMCSILLQRFCKICATVVILHATVHESLLLCLSFILAYFQFQPT